MSELKHHLKERASGFWHIAEAANKKEEDIVCR